MGRLKKGENPKIYFITNEFKKVIEDWIKVKSIPKYFMAQKFDFEPSRLRKIITGARLFLTEKKKLEKMAAKINFSGQIFREKLLREPE